MPSKSQHLRPRLCTLEKGDNGYGFHLHGEKGKTGQFIRLVEPDSPAETSGLHAGDRLVFVNGEDVENESHQQVVSRIRATVGRLVLVVVDPDTEQLLKKHNMKCLKEYVSDGIPLPFDEEEEEEVMVEEVVVVEQREVGDADGTINGDERHDKGGEEEEEEEEEEEGTPRESTPVPERNGGEIHVHVEKKLSINSEKEVLCTELRPRLCVIQRGPSGYGFNLHSERARPGQYIRAVDEDSPAERAGLLSKDRIVQVNSLSVEGKTHSEVVAAIKAGGREARLLVVDPDSDAFFKRCRVAPALDHLSGPLPEPVINGGMDEKVNGRGAKERDSTLSVSPSPSNASSNTSLTTLPTNTPPENTIPALNMSLQQVKELAHQKRSNKRAPPMDWTKKNELFSNL
ncbi:Na(+)/H(+) exchange regulatory cofactor NHE-RF1-like isoform X1 [Cyclopterus lumpus]|uniref:Na(+)/H(+) exchange regulatory cofactor NHE-RF1-like isoform X1 n=1 Tax=Cyclopterus lumpus TaxID=8103 RepID=UPI0014862362|nr:Na(+)/H(+) exchange regulatory cofactor NHE-RF1-like isoform X1 [Cyclopterus lumpus]